ncbi:NCL [Symbiodinium sp. CCMP2456]|nr:NCL [Symbiodinium sp. CCMP2456]
MTAKNRMLAAGSMIDSRKACLRCMQHGPAHWCVVREALESDMNARAEQDVIQAQANQALSGVNAEMWSSYMQFCQEEKALQRVDSGLVKPALLEALEAKKRALALQAALSYVLRREQELEASRGSDLKEKHLPTVEEEREYTEFMRCKSDLGHKFLGPAMWQAFWPDEAAATPQPETAASCADLQVLFTKLRAELVCDLRQELQVLQGSLKQQLLERNQAFCEELTTRLAKVQYVPQEGVPDPEEDLVCTPPSRSSAQECAQTPQKLAHAANCTSAAENSARSAHGNPLEVSAAGSLVERQSRRKRQVLHMYRMDMDDEATSPASPTVNEELNAGNTASLPMSLEDQFESSWERAQSSAVDEGLETCAPSWIWGTISAALPSHKLLWGFFIAQNKRQA